MDFYIKEATKEDCLLLYNWVNEESVRQNSFNSNIIDYEEHIIWFNDKLSSKNCTINIFYLNNTPIGQIRLEIINNIGEIDYSIRPESRGKGYGNILIKMFEEKIKLNNEVKILKGKVKKSNLKSQKVFEKNEYKNNINNEYIEYVKYI